MTAYAAIITKEESVTIDIPDFPPEGGGESLNPSVFLAAPDGVTDDTTRIQAALDSIPSGGYVYAPPGTYLISARLNINKSSVRFIGSGMDGFHDIAGTASGSCLKWTGALGGEMLRVSPAAVSTDRGLRGNVVKGFRFDANALASIGLNVLSASHGEYENYFEEFASAGMSLGVVATLGEWRDPQFNRIIVLGKQYTKTGNTLRLLGDSGANASFNVFELVDAQYKDGVSIELVNADNNLFNLVRQFRYPGGTGTGIRFDGGPSEPESARLNTFISVSAGAGGVYAAGTEVPAWTTPSTHNNILSYDKGNGAPNPVIGTGSSLKWVSNLV